MEMKIANKGEYLSLFRNRYRRCSKLGKGRLLDEVTEELSISRKHAIRLLSAKSSGRPRKAGKRGSPGKYQSYDFKLALRDVWRTTNYMCSKSLKSAIPDWLPFIELEKGSYSNEIRRKLLAVSASTMDRILKPYKATKGKSWTRASNFREEIPIQKNVWDITIPGFIEADTVAHCGGSMGGDFINTLTVVDIATLWTEVDAVYGRGSNATFYALKTIESELPFPIKGYDTDNGGEVLNHRIISYFTEQRTNADRPAVQVTRARPYQKNDNAHVEQRNDAIARRYLGYERLEFRELTELISYYYRNIISPLHNHFYPCFKLKDKIRRKTRTNRIYEKPITPYQRLIQSEFLSNEYKEKLQTWHNQLNPLELRRKEKVFRKKIDLLNRKLKSNTPITSHDLRVGKVDRPIFDPFQLLPQPTRISAKKYGRIREVKNAYKIN